MEVANGLFEELSIEEQETLKSFRRVISTLYDKTLKGRTTEETIDFSADVIQDIKDLEIKLQKVGNYIQYGYLQTDGTITWNDLIDMSSLSATSTNDDFRTLINDLKESKSITILGCGTSYHAGLIGKYVIESLVKKRVNVYLASEFNNVTFALFIRLSVMVIPKFNSESVNPSLFNFIPIFVVLNVL